MKRKKFAMKKIIPCLMFLLLGFAFTETKVFALGAYNSYKGTNYGDTRQHLLEMEDTLVSDGYKLTTPGSSLYMRLTNPDNNFPYKYLFDSEYIKVYLPGEKSYESAPFSEIENDMVCVDFYKFDYKADKSNPTGKIDEKIPEGVAAGNITFAFHVSEDTKKYNKSLAIDLFEVSTEEYYHFNVEYPSYKRTVKLPAGTYQIVESHVSDFDYIPQKYIKKSIPLIAGGDLTIEITMDSESEVKAQPQEIINNALNEAENNNRKNIGMWILIIIFGTFVVAAIIAVVVFRKAKKRNTEDF